MFGTFEPEEESVRYGLVKNVNTYDPTKITFMGWQEMFNNIKSSNNFTEALYFIFGPPKTRSE